MKNLVIFLFFVTISNGQIQISDFKYNNVSPVNPQGLTTYNNKMYFTASNDGFGNELWSSDGTQQNTNLFKDFNPGETNGFNIGLVSAIMNNELYFLTKNTYDYSGGEIWKTDGTTAGTIKVSDYTGKINALTTVSNQIFFIINTDEFHYSLWKTDGTTDGTTLVYGPTGTGGPPRFQGKVNNTFIYTLPLNDSVVWRSDGTDAGTFAITGSLDGNGSGPTGTSDLSQYIEYNDKLYFVSRYYLHETDGTLMNTKVVANVWNAGQNLLTFSDVMVVNNKMYFLFFSLDLLKISIYKSDGTQNGTSEIYSETASKYFYPSFLLKDNNNIFFTGGKVTGETTLKSLNTNTNMVSELSSLSLEQKPFIFNSFEHAGKIYKINNSDYFILGALTSNYSNQGWIYNSTENTINNIAALNNISKAFVYNEELYYPKNNQLWKYANNLSIDTYAKTEIAAYPNPTYDFVYLTQPDEIKDISIFDNNGKLIFENPKHNSNRIDISQLQSGVYIMKINQNGTMNTVKIIKK